MCKTCTLKIMKHCKKIKDLNKWKDITVYRSKDSILRSKFFLN